MKLPEGVPNQPDGEGSPDPDGGNVLLVDDQPEMLEVLEALLTGRGHQVSAHLSPESARAYFKDHPDWTDLILSDLNMPGEDGLSLLRGLRSMDDTVVGLVITGFATMDSVMNAMRSGIFDFIVKPVKADALDISVRRALAHRRILFENRTYQRHMEKLVEERSEALRETLNQLENAHQFTLEAMVSMLEAREKATGEHSKRVTSISLILARQIGVEEEELEIIRRGAFLHDIGKVAVPDAILQKPGPLTPEEWKIMKAHVETGYAILQINPDIKEVAEIVRSHHEHFDGSGYPRGLKGTEICLGARIFSVADAYDALRSSRPYSPPQTAEHTLREILRCSATQFDPQVVNALEKCQPEIEQLWISGQINTAAPPIEKAPA